jgi:hypothetical protein
MLSGNWCLYERRSQRWIFCRRKRVIGMPLFTVIALLAAGTTAWLAHF